MHHAARALAKVETRVLRGIRARIRLATARTGVGHGWRRWVILTACALLPTLTECGGGKDSSGGDAAVDHGESGSFSTGDATAGSSGNGSSGDSPSGSSGAPGDDAGDGQSVSGDEARNCAAAHQYPQNPFVKL